MFMLDQRYRWKNKQLREHIEVLDGSRAPHILLTNATLFKSGSTKMDNSKYLDL